ncbi:hypothetical protein [Desulfatirhabdium butyrativorans]|uniref:hypothetical protein n=1 Tax=Desulfatirhabdium butyrativorans TaxID=340467 RepID=UPI0004096591|nr:hypothetical protein [Desulfatirhabdium butyrativorans]
MHHYDIAAKVLIDNCRDEILRRFLQIDVTESCLIEGLPQETASVRTSDFPLRVTESDGRQLLVVLEIQSRWENRLPLRLLEYRIRHMMSEDLPAVSAVLLLRPDNRAVDHFEDAEVHYRFRLIRLYEMDAKAAVKSLPTCLLPFVPLMKGGTDAVRQVEETIYRSDLPSVQRADMLTSMTILSGLISDRLAQDILSRRRDLMIESAAYDIIKQEGIQQGVLLGSTQGKVEAMREHLIDLLTVRFGAPSKRLTQQVMAIQELPILQALWKQAMTASSMRSFATHLKKLA